LNKKNKKSPAQYNDTDFINDLIIESIKELKGKNIVKIDMREIDGSPADFFIICEGNSTIQVSSIADNIYKKIKQEKRTLPISFEGKNNSLWVLLDYFSTVVHVFYPETRQFYNLESLWNDGKIEKIKD